MKKIYILLLTALCAAGAFAQTKPAIAYYAVSVDSDIRDAFRPLPDNTNKSEADALKEAEQFLKDEATATKTGYRKYDAMLTDTCLIILKKALQANNIELGDKVPKDGAFSYTNYDYPQMALKKAAKSGVAQNYMKMSVTFTYEESFMESSKEPGDKSKMTPRVKVELVLADAAGKSISEGKSEATSDNTIQLQQQKLYAGNKQIEGSGFRADETTRTTLFFQLFDKALTGALSKMK